jgi:hypothetical protein
LTGGDDYGQRDRTLKNISTTRGPKIITLSLKESLKQMKIADVTYNF